ncbi:GH36-type glycosyl hydrolase domain-containing protein [Rubrivivax gelatinosus]|uniref:Glycosyltransferase 36 n=1 Tax=Rubrivivax gelatinosus (strain NBRC 100245 / IL144) TaxID=983917 RepID=I0HVS2_RUBGI|nr:glucoamylase family protein [Rubrivivax gelatinosus]BAL97109.1 glycosyltransferase 36 [Rubrivivax gelatinosus IL144]
MPRRPPDEPALPAALQGLLAPGRAPPLPPVRSEIFGAQRFAQHGRSLAATHEAEPPAWGAAGFFPRLRDNIAVLRRAYAAIAAQAAAGDEPGPAALWLLDNFYLIDAQLEAIHDGLPRGFFRRLPVLRAEPLAGLPRVYGVAWAFVAHTDSAFDEALLVAYLGAYQETRELALAETWALPTVLRVVLVENLRRLAERLAIHKAAGELADRCAERLAQGRATALEPLHRRLAAHGAGEVFLARLAERLQDEPADEATHAWLAARLPNLAALQRQLAADQAADNLSVGNAVHTLRTLGEADWPEIVARCSPLMQRLLGDPLFAAEHHRTRDATLHAVEALARRSGHGEMRVAAELLALMRGGQGASAAAGHWLDGPGRPALARALGLHEPLAAAWRRVAPRLALPAYLAAVGLGSLAALAAVRAADASWAWALLAAWPASELAIALLHRLVGESLRPRHLPRLALAAGIPADQRVLVVVPAMLADRATIDTLVHRLLLHRLANPEAHAQFALLSDWADADAAGAAGDAELLAHAQAAVAALEHEYGDPGGPQRFLLLHRARRYSRSETRWIGWERKRGKLEQLVAELAEHGGPADGRMPAFVDLGRLSRPAPLTRHLVTLDGDTQLPPGRLRELVGIAAHPSNRPVLAADGRRVVAGYAILQPRLVTPLPLPHEDTFFHRLFAGQSGVDPYDAASSEVYQDLFGEGSFSGKGLLDVQAVHAVLAGRLPEDRVLSHDLLEGALARCAVVTDVTLVEDAPFHAEVAASRVHRWTRGDWQLLPILLRSLRHPAQLPLGAVNRWKLADNLRRSLVAPGALALLLAALAGFAATPAAALALVAAAFGAGPLLGALAGMVPAREQVARRHFYAGVGRDLARSAGGTAWFVAMLLQHTLLAADAIGRALWRLLVSQRLLLQWTTAAAAQAAARDELGVALRRHWGVMLAAAAIAAAAWALPTPHPVAAALLCALWAGAPLWSWAVSRTGFTRQPQACPEADLVYLHGIARDTWHFFERCVGPADRHLPPDNLQSQPHEMLAHRSSPTNIGLYLLATACARRFGWIGDAELLRRLEATLDTLDGLARHRGHFLNWYDTRSGEPLPPLYVSTADSGNLGGHLLAVAQACLERARVAAEPEGRRLAAVAARCRQLAWAPDYRFLYDPRRHLLHIGWRVAEMQADAGFYDLLASESRLASLLAIAKGDVPVRHWAALARPFYAVGTTAGLRSWSGSMFEYLMPSLILAEPHGSVLHEAGVAALREQRDYAAARGVPWGISESAYAGCDHTLAYQYAPQGVPRLALRRTPPDELVIAPYATALAALLRPQRAARNFAVLQALGARGTMGFVEALDFSPARQTGGETPVLVHTVMAHHQGMSLVALANVLLDGAPQRWGMADPHLEAVASLLHERAPREVSRLATPSALPQPLPRRGAPALRREVLPGAHAVEPTQLLANGRYGVALRANGAGRSRRGRHDIHRCRDDALRDACGQFLYLRRADTAPLVSLTQHPAPDDAAEYRSVFHADRVVFEAEWPDLQARVTVWVSPEDDIEFRQVELSQGGDEPLSLELLSAFEVTLAEAAADEAHPAFAKLFVSARRHAAQRALVFERRPRLAGEPALHMAHFLAESAPGVGVLRHQVDRRRWLGRNRGAWQPLGLLEDTPPGADPQELDTGLDPVCVLGVRLTLAPGARLRLTFATAAADDAPTLRSMLDKYLEPSHVERASRLSATLAGVRLGALQMGADGFTRLQSLATALLLTLTRPGVAEAGVVDRRLLWRFGLSGERPLVLVAAATLPGLGLVRTLSQALSLWSWAGLSCDLVVINAEAPSYAMPLQHALAALRDRHDADAAARPQQAASGWHLLAAADLSADERSTLQVLARIRLRADGRALAAQLDDWVQRLDEDLRRQQDGSSTPLAAAPHAAAAVPASRGRFGAGGAYAFEAGSARRPPRPWSNVLANEGFGSVLTEAGGGCTWAVNSRMNQLTPWSNDAVADPCGEQLLLQDLATRRVWSVTPSAAAEPGIAYRVEHAPGFTRISHRRGALEVEARWCVDADAALRQVQLRLRNTGPRPLALRLVGVCEWQLGARLGERATVRSAHHPGVLLATQPEQGGGFGGGTAFLAWAEGELGDDWTCQRRELFDARGRPVLPDHLGGRAGAGLDPCAALGLRLELAPGEEAGRTLLLGWAPDAEAALALARRAAALPPVVRLQTALARWETLLGAVSVATPDPLFDVMVNRWLPYQTLACRLWARAGFYQAGGATGFRDQLQDAVALAWAAPQLLREQILRCAARQFAEGDVQHWWHAPGGAGVRTHFSDDLLWLPYAVSQHLARGGDAALLDETVAFIEGLEIPPGAEDIYGTPTVGAAVASVYEHAARAIDRSLRVGAHGLPLMGSGDWNDGMNRVGHEGRGESVWLAWFLCRVVADFGPLACARGEAERAGRWDEAAEGWRAALLGPAWDGRWYRRAFFDDGSVLGSAANTEARIDLVAQAWAVLSGVAPAERCGQALAAVQTELVDAEAGLIRLLHPPLAQAVPSAGYIQTYPPGVRENGGQYSHAAVWALMALLQHAPAAADPQAEADRAWRWWQWLSPAHRAADPAQAEAYEAEPYVMAGDVYAAPPWTGRGGWSWYTGSAAWMQRAALESIFGLVLDGRWLSLRPALPGHWPQAALTLRRGALVLHLRLQRAGCENGAWGAGVVVHELPAGAAFEWAGRVGEHALVVPLPPGR